MPLPLVLAGAALAAGGFGAKKGKDAYKDFKGAKERNERAQRWVREGERALEEARDATKTAMEGLGETKFAVYQQSILPFVETFNRIKSVDFDDNDRVSGDLPKMDSHTFDDMRGAIIDMSDMLQGSLSAVGSGALAGLAAYGGVGAFGAASTGTAIGGLSGAAATNATLAWLGGGSLASGGFGMAGGMAVLGGVVAGPVLAVGGMIAASKAKEALENAKANQAEAEQARDQMLAAADAAHGIGRRFDEISEVIKALDLRFQPMLQNLRTLVDANQDYPTYTDDQKKSVFMTASLAKVLKMVMESPVINEKGSLTPESRHAVESGNEALGELGGDEAVTDVHDESSAETSSPAPRLVDTDPVLGKYRSRS